MPEHFAHSVGKVVRGRKHFREELQRASDAATARTGVPHRFEPVDLRDREALGVTDEGLDATARRAVAEGRAEVRRWL